VLDFDALLAESLKAGSTVAAFWEMTPRETYALIQAEGWRREQAQRGRAWLAWHIGALQRTKRFPSLQRLMGPDKPKALSADEMASRREEFQEMKAIWERKHS